MIADIEWAKYMKRSASIKGQGKGALGKILDSTKKRAGMVEFLYENGSNMIVKGLGKGCSEKDVETIKREFDVPETEVKTFLTFVIAACDFFEKAGATFSLDLQLDDFFEKAGAVEDFVHAVVRLGKIAQRIMRTWKLSSLNDIQKSFKVKTDFDLDETAIIEFLVQVVMKYDGSIEDGLSNPIESRGQPLTNWNGTKLLGGEVLARLGQCAVVPAFGASGVEGAPIALLDFIEKNEALLMKLYEEDVKASKNFARRAGGQWSTNVNFGAMKKEGLVKLFCVVSDDTPIELKEKTAWSEANVAKLEAAVAEANNAKLVLAADDGYLEAFHHIMEKNNPIPEVMENHNAISIVNNQLCIGRAKCKMDLSKLPALRIVKWDHEFLRIIFRGLTFQDRMPDQIPGIQFVGLGFSKKAMIRMIFEALINDKIVDRNGCSTVNSAHFQGPVFRGKSPLCMNKNTEGWNFAGAEAVAFTRDDCFFEEKHSAVCKAWGKVMIRLTEDKYKIILEGCDMWPVWEAKVDFDNDETKLLKTGGIDLRQKIFSQELQETDGEGSSCSEDPDKACMLAMEKSPQVLMKAVYCFYKAIEARSSVKLIENEDLKWQGGYAVVAMADEKRILGDVAVACDDWGEVSNPEGRQDRNNMLKAQKASEASSEASQRAALSVKRTWEECEGASVKF